MDNKLPDGAIWMKQSVPLLNLQQQYELISSELEAAVLQVLRSGNYILGENVVRLEHEVAQLSGCQFGIGVANGTDALCLALWALDVGPGDEVITTPFTFAATVEAITLRGARPVFVDVHEASFNIDPYAIERAITSRTKVLLPVHLYGLPADMHPIKELAAKYKLRIIEDNAQAIGALYRGKPTGSFGDIATISFYPTKNLGAAGDAGMVVTNDDQLAERLKSLRAHGSRKRYFHDELGVNSRLDEMQAAVLLAKLPYLSQWNTMRNRVAQRYTIALSGCDHLKTPEATYASAALAAPPDVTHVWHQYTVRITSTSPTRDSMVAELAKHQIGSMCYYPVPLHLQKAFADLGYKRGDFPISEALADQVLSLPMYPDLTDEQVGLVANALINVLGAKVLPQPAVMPTPFVV